MGIVGNIPLRSHWAGSDPRVDELPGGALDGVFVAEADTGDDEALDHASLRCHDGRVPIAQPDDRGDIIPARTVWGGRLRDGTHQSDGEWAHDAPLSY